MSSFLTPYLFWIKLAGIVLLMAGSAAASGYVIHNADTVTLQKFRLAQANAQKADISASLTQLQGFIANMQTADTGYESELETLDQDFNNLQKEFHNATLKPLPVDCRPDVGRLHVLTDAVGAANKAAAAGR